MLDKAAEVYTQTLQAGVIGVAVATIFLAFFLAVIVILMMADSRRREVRHDAQLQLYQGMTSTLGQIASSIPPLSNTVTLASQAATQDHKNIIEKIDDTKTRLQAIAESHATLSNKLDALPQSIVTVLDSKLSTVEAALISARNVLALIPVKPNNE